MRDEFARMRSESSVGRVRRGPCPRWLTRACRSLSRFPWWWPGQIVLQRTVEQLGCGELYDHPGVCVVEGHKCFVLEPYPGGLGLPPFETARREHYESKLDRWTAALSLSLKCDVTWSRNSWHNPGWTYRIVFKEPAAEAF